MGRVDQIDEIFAVVAVPSRPRLLNRAVRVHVHTEVGDGREVTVREALASPAATNTGRTRRPRGPMWDWPAPPTASPVWGSSGRVQVEVGWAHDETVGHSPKSGVGRSSKAWRRSKSIMVPATRPPVRRTRLPERPGPTSARRCPGGPGCVRAPRPRGVRGPGQPTHVLLELPVGAHHSEQLVGPAMSRAEPTAAWDRS